MQIADDKDGSGDLSSAELRKALAQVWNKAKSLDPPLEMAGMKEVQAKLDEDGDGDGEVTLEEWKTGLTADFIESLEQIGPALRKFFKLMDKGWEERLAAMQQAK